MRRRRLLATTGGLLAGPAIATGRTQVGMERGSRHASPGALDGEPIPSRRLVDASGQIDADRTRIEIALAVDGSAEWRLELWTRLDDEDAEDAFQTLEDDVAANPEQYVERFESRMHDTLEVAETSTGRSMTAREFDVRTETRPIPQEYGLLIYTFVWDGFGTIEGPELHAGDAIDGFLLDEGTRLTITWPEPYDLASVLPEPDDRNDRRIVWRGGQTDFFSGEPRLVVSRDTGALSDWLPLAGVGLVGGLATLGLGWWLYQRRSTRQAIDAASGGSASDGGASAETGGVATSDGDDATASAADATAADDGTGTTTTADGDSTHDDITADDTTADGDTTADEGPPSELLTNEERVLALLEQHDGRLKQQQVVSELDWTEAKTSQVVTGMREEGTIEVFRIGRENVLSLPDEDNS